MDREQEEFSKELYRLKFEYRASLSDVRLLVKRKRRRQDLYPQRAFEYVNPFAWVRWGGVHYSMLTALVIALAGLANMALASWVFVSAANPMALAMSSLMALLVAARAWTRVDKRNVLATALMNFLAVTMLWAMLQVPPESLGALGYPAALAGMFLVLLCGALVLTSNTLLSLNLAFAVWPRRVG